LNGVVCNKCNQYFGDNIELTLGRDSLEGIARYRYGIIPKGTPILKRLRLSILGPHKMRGVHVIPRLPIQGGTEEIQIATQVGFYSAEKNEYRYYDEADIPSREELEQQGVIPSDKEVVFYGDIQRLQEVLKNKGIDVKITERREELENIPAERIPVEVRARIDPILYRAFSKIALNYLAYCEGAEFVLKDDFNGIRNFIRYGQGQGRDFFEANSEPILMDEKRVRRRRLQAHIVVVEWNGYDLQGKLSMFNSVIGITYIIKLCRNYRGVWFPIQKGHCFGLRSGEVRELCSTKLTGF
jgi:hypothetical protein